MAAARRRKARPAGVATSIRPPCAARRLPRPPRARRAGTRGHGATAGRRRLRLGAAARRPLPIPDPATPSPSSLTAPPVCGTSRGMLPHASGLARKSPLWTMRRQSGRRSEAGSGSPSYLRAGRRSARAYAGTVRGSGVRPRRTSAAAPAAKPWCSRCQHPSGFSARTSTSPPTASPPPSAPASTRSRRTASPTASPRGSPRCARSTSSSSTPTCSRSRRPTRPCWCASPRRCSLVAAPAQGRRLSGAGCNLDAEPGARSGGGAAPCRRAYPGPAGRRAPAFCIAPSKL